jgi:hypothetical protein
VSVNSERYKKQRDPQEPVRLVLTVAQAKAYCEVCWAGAVLVLRTADTIQDPCQQRETRAVGMELLRLANGFGRRVEEP